MWLILDKREVLLKILKKWLRSLWRMNAGIPLAEFDFDVGKAVKRIDRHSRGEQAAITRQPPQQGPTNCNQELLECVE
jgi:hypothetical protein